MSKQLVILTIGSGCCHEGFSATLQIWGSSGLSTIQGSLPPCTDLVKYYQKWSFMYGNFLFPVSNRVETIHRISPHGKVLIEELNQTTTDVKQSLNSWLNSLQFSKIKDGLKEHFLKNSSVRNPIFLINEFVLINKGYLICISSF